MKKHEKNSVTDLQSYKAYLKKIGLDQEAVTLRKKRDRYDELFDRYMVPELDRHYVFYDELKKLDRTIDYD